MGMLRNVGGNQSKINLIALDPAQVIHRRTRFNNRCFNAVVCIVDQFGNRNKIPVMRRRRRG